FSRCFAALLVEPGDLLRRDETVVRFAVSVSQQQEPDTPLVERAIDGRADVFLEQLVRIVVSRNLKNRLLQLLARGGINRILRLAAAVDDVPQMKDEIAFGFIELGHGLPPLFLCLEVVVSAKMSVAHDGERKLLDLLRRWQAPGADTGQAAGSAGQCSAARKSHAKKLRSTVGTTIQHIGIRQLHHACSQQVTPSFPCTAE